MWAEICDEGVLTHALKLSSSVAYGSDVRLMNGQGELQVSIGADAIIRTNGSKLRIGARELRNRRKWFTLIGLQSSDGSDVEFDWEAPELLHAWAMSMRALASGRTYRFLIQRQPALAIQTQVRVECESDGDDGLEMLGLLSYLWTQVENERRSSA